MQKERIKSLLFKVLRQKFNSYKPETSYMPFHTRLLGKDRMALFHTILTNQNHTKDGQWQECLI